MTGIPAGFELMPPFGPSHEAIGPIYFKAGDKGWVIGMRVEQRHHNRGPMLHGGIMAFFIDTAFTHACKFAADPPLKTSPAWRSGRLDIVCGGSASM